MRGPRNLSRLVAPAYRMDRRDFARRLQHAIDFARTSYRALARDTAIPERQIRALAHGRRPVMDWAYHGMLLWLAEADAREAAHARSRRYRKLGPQASSEVQEP